MIDFKLYLITDRRLCRKPFLECIEEVCREGIKAIQLREKELSSRELLELALSVREITSKYNVKLLINDRIDIAMITNADGIQLPENGLPIKIARRNFPKKLIGVSCHGIERALIAENEGADFIVFGSVFKKKHGSQPQGIDALKSICLKIKIPVFAVGGITPENAGLCLKSGAYGVAVISSIMSADNIAIQVRKLLDATE